jgi:hypothetical protein
MNNNEIQQISTPIASINNWPPSFFDSIPITKRWDSMAPDINPIPNNAPTITVAGINKRILANNSITPVPIRPQGSTPNFVNSSTDSG